MGIFEECSAALKGLVYYNSMKHIAVVGTGYVGLVSGACFAELGHTVTCVDIDAAKIESLRAGVMPIYESGLGDVVARNVKAGRLHFTLDLAEALATAEVVFLAVPTPSAEDGSADLRHMHAAADSLAPLLRRYTVIVDKSTVPVGTAAQIRERIAAHASQPFDVVSNPEFLREGVALDDFMKPDRIVIGSSSPRAIEVMRGVYKPITDAGYPLIAMDESSAELTKYAANAFLALKITFINQIANLCDVLGADVDLVRQGIGSDPRIGSQFLYPGIGYGGSCFPKDVLALHHTAKTHHGTFRLLDAVIDGNKAQQQVLSQKVLQHYGGEVRGRCFALWGLAFKPDTDDVRESPALVIARTLVEAGATIRAYDPEGMPGAARQLSGLHGFTLAKDKLDALRGADALLVATAWDTFKQTSPKELKAALKDPVIFDGRNMWDPATMRAQGFYYEGIGRPRPSFAG